MSEPGEVTLSESEEQLHRFEKKLLESLIKSNPLILFTRRNSRQELWEIMQIANLLNICALRFKEFNKETAEDYGIEQSIADHLLSQVGDSPMLFVQGKKIGGLKDLKVAFGTCLIDDLMDGTFEEYEYDLIVIGGGITGRTMALEATRYHKKVALCDYPVPTAWGPYEDVACAVGIMWKAASVHKKYGRIEAFKMKSAKKSPKAKKGIRTKVLSHKWSTLITHIKNYDKREKWEREKDYCKCGITHYKAKATFDSPHSVKFIESNEDSLITTKRRITAQNIVIATGAYPEYRTFPGAEDYCLPIDRFCFLEYHPRKTLFIGDSYGVLVCAGILQNLGAQCFIMLRSSVPSIQGIDRDALRKVVRNLRKNGIKFLHNCTPIKVTMLKSGSPPLLEIIARGKTTRVLTFNTIFLDKIRLANTSDLGLEEVGVRVDRFSDKVIVDDYDRTSNMYIFALGIVNGKCHKYNPHVSATAASLLASRIYDGGDMVMDYSYTPFVIHTPIECAMVGFGEQRAIDAVNGIQVFHQSWKTVEHSFTQYRLRKKRSKKRHRRRHNECFVKAVCTDRDLKVLGVCIIAPLAGEAIRGLTDAIKCGISLEEFERHFNSYARVSRPYVGLELKDESESSSESSESSSDSSRESSEDKLDRTISMFQKGHPSAISRISSSLISCDAIISDFLKAQEDAERS